jgi:hypothetical protein
MTRWLSLKESIASTGCPDSGIQGLSRRAISTVGVDRYTRSTRISLDDGNGAMVNVAPQRDTIVSVCGLHLATGCREGKRRFFFGHLGRDALEERC